MNINAHLTAIPWSAATDRGWVRGYVDALGELVAFAWHRVPLLGLDHRGPGRMQGNSLFACAAHIGWAIPAVEGGEDATVEWVL